MTPEQVKIFKDSLIRAVDQHLSQGGTLKRGNFGFYPGSTCMCPVSCLIKDIPQPSDDDGYEARLSVALGFYVSADEMFDFIFGFDNNMFDRADTTLFQVGQELSKKYFPQG